MATMGKRWEWVALAALAGLLPVTIPAAIASTPTAYLPGVQTSWEQRAQDMNVTVVFTDDERNCGAQLGGLTGGCFNPATPDRIYIGSWLSAESLERVGLHELAHAWYFSQGIDETECLADRLAAEWGASGPFQYCN